MASVLALVAVAYLLVGWWVIFDIRIGPTVAVITPTHGVHTGDMVGLGALVLGALAGVVSVCLAVTGFQGSRRWLTWRHTYSTAAVRAR